jgi:hypothetical protein
MYRDQILSGAFQWAISARAAGHKQPTVVPRRGPHGPGRGEAHPGSNREMVLLRDETAPSSPSSNDATPWVLRNGGVRAGDGLDITAKGRVVRLRPAAP